MVMRAVSGVGGMVGEQVTAWSGEQLRDTLSADEWTKVIVDIAQDHCDAMQQRVTYRLSHERDKLSQSSFIIKLAPEDAGQNDDDEDPSPDGQIRAQMAHTRMVMSMALRTPMAVIEMLSKMLQQANERIAQLERERAQYLDIYADALQMAAVAEAKPDPSMPEQIEAWTKAVPEMAKVVPLLVSGIKTIMKT